MKLITVVGARPQFIKAAAVSRAFREFPSIEEKIVHTGQHFDANMSEVFFEEMEIPKPHYHLEINSLSHGAMTGRMLEQVEKVLQAERADALMVYGDTNSTLAGALAARKLNIPVIHVEAGLRSFNMNMPEEINRILTDRISQLLFCPHKAAVENLRREGFEQFPCQIFQVGDVMEDAALYFAPKAVQQSDILNRLKLTAGQFALCTIHRAENTDNLANLTAIVSALNAINQYLPVVLPMHPRTQKILETNNLQLEALVIPAVGYFDMLALLQHCQLVLTDSGGLQKEAFFFGKFCLTMREETEWVELVENGYSYLTGTDAANICALVKKVQTLPYPAKTNLYGGGNAAQRIAQHIADMV